MRHGGNYLTGDLVLAAAAQHTHHYATLPLPSPSLVTQLVVFVAVVVILLKCGGGGGGGVPPSLRPPSPPGCEGRPSPPTRVPVQWWGRPPTPHSPLSSHFSGQLVSL